MVGENKEKASTGIFASRVLSGLVLDAAAVIATASRYQEAAEGLKELARGTASAGGVGAIFVVGASVASFGLGTLLLKRARRE